MKRLNKLLGIGILGAGLGLQSAAYGATYDLGPTTPSSVPVTTSDAGFTFSDLTAVGLSASGFSNHFYFPDWEATLNPAKYMSLTVTHAGTFAFANMTFSAESTGPGPATMVVRSSVDGFTADIDSFTWASASADVTNGEFDLSGMPPATGSVELRFYVTSADASSHGFANHEPGGAGGGLPDVGRDIEIIPIAGVAAAAAPVEPAQVPVMGPWGLGLMAGLLVLLGRGRLRRNG